MTDRETFRSQVRSSKIGDTVRLVYADWLDENDPDKAAFAAYLRLSFKEVMRKAAPELDAVEKKAAYQAWMVREHMTACDIFAVELETPPDAFVVQRWVMGPDFRDHWRISHQCPDLRKQYQYWLKSEAGYTDEVPTINFHNVELVGHKYSIPDGLVGRWYMAYGGRCDRCGEVTVYYGTPVRRT